MELPATKQFISRSNLVALAPCGDRALKMQQGDWGTKFLVLCHSNYLKCKWPLTVAILGSAVLERESLNVNLERVSLKEIQ